MRAAIACLLLLWARPASCLDWPEAEARMLEHLRALIRLDTTNPPGNEILAARYIKEELDKEGIRSEILASTGTRASLLARLPGSGRKRPFLIICHTDVVPAERGRWSVDPFAAEVKDGYVWGRGAADVKSMCAAGMAVLTLLKRSGAPLDRDVLFLAQADEESGGAGRHIDWLLKEHPGKLAAEFAVNEGGHTHWEDGRISAVDVQCAEKQYVDLRLTAAGAAGHASLPNPRNPVHALARALARLSAWAPPPEFSPVSRRYFEALAAEGGPRLREAARELGGPGWRDAAGRIAALKPEYGAMLSDHCAATILQAGYKSNVVPDTASAQVNCRLLPGRSLDRFLEDVRRVIAEPSVEVLYDGPELPPSLAMPVDGEMFRAIEAAVGRLAPGAPVRPYLSLWSTDAPAFRARGVQVYGLHPPLAAADLSGPHGTDERLPIAGLNAYLRILYDVTSGLSAAGEAP